MYYFIYLETAFSIKMRPKFGSLISKIKQSAKSANIDVDDLKELLVLCSTSEEKEIEKEIQEAENLFKVFVILRNKLCSPDNIEILKVIVDHFNLSGALTDIREYEKVNFITYMLLYLFCNLDLILRSTQTCFRYY